MDPATLAAIYTVLATFGLVVTDSYFNANTMYLDTTVAESVREDGYEVKVVDGIFFAEVKKILSIKSLAAAPKIQSSKTKPFSAALAEAANLESALSAVHALLGVSPPKLVASVIVEDSNQRVQILQSGPDGRVAEYTVGDDTHLKLILTGNTPRAGYFDIQVKGKTESEDLDELIREAAFKAVLKLDPYLAILSDLHRRAEAGEDLAPIRGLIDQNLASHPDSVTHQERALTENLSGIYWLLQQNQMKAREEFTKVTISHPLLPIGHLNLAFLDVHEDKYVDAIKKVERVIYPTYWPMTNDPVLLASGYIIKGAAETEMRNFKAAEASFQMAASLHPVSSEVYIYWARMLEKAGRQTEADRMFHQARENSVHFENFPEMALLYFWLTEEGNQPLQRRIGMAEVL